jgi:hypothetical protein
MKRYCTIIEKSGAFKRSICIDNENAEEIKKILFKDEKYRTKFKYIVRRILETPNIYFNDYKRIENHSGIKLTEMRFFPNGDNCRIYCRELNIDEGMFCIIMVKVLPKKKSMKMNKSIKQMIEAIKNYEYEFEK